MRSRKTNHVGIAFTLLSLCLIGCQSDSGGGGNTQAAVGATPQPVDTSGAVRLDTGTAPMQQMISSGGHLRIMDTTSGTMLLKTDVPPQSMVRIDEKSGVYIGKKRAVLGPLPAGHKYEIWLDRR